MFHKATKAKAKLRLALTGPSGSGKTFSALQIAQHLGSSIALIDTEHGSASKYAHQFEFDTCQLTNFHPNKYIEAIAYAGQGGYEVIVVDSLTHAWFWELDASAKGANSFTAWANIRPLERALIQALLSSPAHVIVTMRSKTEWVLEESLNKRGDKVSAPRRVGTAPVQAAGIEYEFDVAGELDLNHMLTISKSRCSALADTQMHCPGQELAQQLLCWLEDGVQERTPQLTNSEQIAVALDELGITNATHRKQLVKQFLGDRKAAALDEEEMQAILSTIRASSNIEEEATLSA
jgi:AAA domain